MTSRRVRSGSRFIYSLCSRIVEYAAARWPRHFLLAGFACPADPVLLTLSSIVSARPSYPPKSNRRTRSMARSTLRWILKFAPQNSTGRAAVLTLIYVTTVALCFWAAYQIRFDFDVPPTFQSSFLQLLLPAVSAKLVGLLVFRHFDGLLTYFGNPDLNRLVQAC